MRAQSRAEGFTLIELLVVVVIIAILAAVAIPAFSSYVMRARAAEAPTFLGEIRQRQEAYRAEFGRYADIEDEWTPDSLPAGGEVATFPADHEQWRQLGAFPDGAVRFQYGIEAGTPGTTPDEGLGYENIHDFWFVSNARADLDGDDDYLEMQGYSHANHIWVSEAKGWE